MRTLFQRAAIAALAVVVVASPAFGAATTTAANAALQAGRADEAAVLLNEILGGDANNADANNLLCRVEYTLQKFDQAQGPCEKAIRVSPQNARYHLWLGRVMGERAGKASFLSAFSMAKKTREEFETAVKLDAKDADALTDLGQFYQEAPGAVGGGMDKAQKVAEQLESVDKARGLDFRAEIAERQKDLAEAERQFKAAIAVAKHPAFQWMALGSFYRRHERWADMEAAVKSGQAAAKADKHSAVALYNGASILARANRQPELAGEMFEAYVASPDKTEEAPAFDALVKLSKLRKQAGDTAGAQREKAAALALAKDYKPAQDLKF